MNKRHPLRFAFGTIVVITIGVMFGAMAWSFLNWNANKPLTTLTPQGPNAQIIQDLNIKVFAIAALVFVGVMGIVLYIVFRYRDTGDIETEDVMPAQLHGKTWAEIAWTAAPGIVLFFVALFTVITLGELNAEPKPTALKVKVEGQQWWWRFSYDNNNDGVYGGPGDVVTANELVIPINREIALTETSNDVIHSFWIPALNGKKDAVPGMTTDWKLQADGVGVYRGQCTEFCGLSHANMRMLVRAVSETDYLKWSDNQLLAAKKPAPGSLEAAGEEVFKGQLCSSCHLIRGVNDEKVANPESGVKSQLVSGVAPDLTHFGSRGTFAGSIFNSHYPNPENPVQGDIPFGQTCRVRGLSGSGKDANGQPIDQAKLPECPSANVKDTLNMTYASAPGNPDNPPDRTALGDWLRDPPALKPMAPEPEPQAGGLKRGMPNLKLSEEQINQLVAYLDSLK
jgi:cytochrome c oxidase subunit 2